MGTSASYRAPERPRWSAFIAALVSDESIDRVRSELFNAGSDWQIELAAPAIATFAEALVRLHSELPRRLAESEAPDATLGAVIAETRHASMRTGFSAASALAERAFARLLLATVEGLSVDPGGAASRWEASRGTPPEFVAKYVGELLGQYARHVTDREAGRLVGEAIGADASARVSDGLAERATSVGFTAASEILGQTADVASVWAEVVNHAFEVGRTLPRDES